MRCTMKLLLIITGVVALIQTVLLHKCIIAATAIDVLQPTSTTSEELQDSTTVNATNSVEVLTPDDHQHVDVSIPDGHQNVDDVITTADNTATATATAEAANATTTANATSHSVRELFHGMFKHKAQMAQQRLMFKHQLPVMMQVQQMKSPRVNVQQIIKEKSCPAGMTLTNDACISITILAPDYVCPPSTLFTTTGECLSTARPRLSCPHGSNMHGNRCVACKSVPAQLTCPNPSIETLDPLGLCISTMSQPPECPPMYTMVDNECIQAVPNMLVCPEGDLSAGQCVKTVNRFPATPICPNGASFNPTTQMCVMLQQIVPMYSCDHGFKLDHDSSSCIRRVNSVPIDCPPGFHPIPNNVCEKVDRCAADVLCPNGFSLDQTSCIKHVPIPPQCPPGYQLSSSNLNLCEQPVHEVPTCADNQELMQSGKSVRCRVPTVHALIQCCPPGFELVGLNKCRRIEVLVPILSCKNECYAVRSTPVAYVCAEDAQFVFNPVSPTCVRRVPQQPCMSERHVRNLKRCLEQGPNKTVPNNVVPDNTVPTPSVGGEQPQLRRLSGGGDVVMVDDCDQHELNLQQVQLPLCTEVPMIEEISAAIPHCPAGGEINGDQCVIREPIIPTKRCKVGQLDPSTGQCVREIIIPAKTNCPPGTQRTGMSCMSFSYSDPIFICPPHTHISSNGVCVSAVNALLPPPEVIRATPIYQCSTGELSPDNDCVAVMRALPIMACPEGSINVASSIMSTDGTSTIVSDSLQCIVKGNVIYSPPVEKCIKPKYTCPDATRMYHAECVAVQVMQPESICPNDAIFNNDQCIRSTNSRIAVPPITVATARAALICPVGSELKGLRCVINQEVDVIVSCPVQFNYDHSKQQCFRLYQPQAACPIGASLSDDGSCIHQTVVPPIIRITQGCSYEMVQGPTCSECVNNNVVSSCPNRIQQ